MSQQAVLLEINQIGNLMADQPEKTKDSPATVQDLRNIGIAIDANFMTIRSEMTNGFTKVDARFTTIDAEFKTVRSEMKTGFSDAKESLTRWSMAIFFSVVALVIAIVGSILLR